MTSEQVKAWLQEYIPLKFEAENRREYLKHLKACAEQLPTQDCDSGLHARSNYELLALAQEHYIEYGKEYLPLIEANEKAYAERGTTNAFISDVMRIRGCSREEVLQRYPELSS